jgi:calcineurin-like phosphoesterase family protein
MNEIYFSSDTHLNHTNIIKYCSRPFDSADDMNHTIISQWNETVPSNGRVYHLGDLAFCRDDSQFRDIVTKLNGQISLIIGNHDNFKQVMRNKDLFVEVTNMKEIKHEGQKITLCHYAMRTWNCSHHGAWHLYGHSHGLLPPYGKSFDVGVDSHGFRPISFTEVKEVMDKRPMIKDHEPATRVIEELKNLSEADRQKVLEYFSSPKAGDTCPYCKAGELTDIPGVHPYSEDHLQCLNCDSTYCKEV